MVAFSADYSLGKRKGANSNFQKQDWNHSEASRYRKEFEREKDQAQKNGKLATEPSWRQKMDGIGDKNGTNWRQKWK